MRIAHVSDIHVRNVRYHDEYRRVFEDLYSKLRDLKPDLIVNTGDTVHQKTSISPELVELTSDLFRNLAEIAPLHSILGNHDMNLMNKERQDAITPIVQNLRAGSDMPVFLHKRSGPVRLGIVGGCAVETNFWIFGMADSENYPRPSQWAELSSDINIGLFHGSVATCVTDSNWRMTHTEHDLSIFDGLDYCLMGDIHKQQFFNNRRFAYAGSLIQQNFGEDADKGFLLWDIESKETHSVRHFPLEGSRRFYTLRLNDDLSFPSVVVEPDSRLRIAPPREITLAEQKEIEKLARQQYRPHDVITLSATNIGSQKTSVGKARVEIENLRQLAVQERLLRDFLEERELPARIIDRALDLNRKYQLHIDQSDETVRNVSWKLNKLSWSNLFNYGEDNLVDFDALGGLTGIFAPNASGKSNFIDVILETCFDSTTRGVNKNIFLINDNKESASMVADVSVNSQNYLIERTIERIKFAKNGENKEWGKTVVNFAMVDEVGDQQEALVGTLRPETERNIRQRLGTYEDMLLTSLSAQWNPMDIIACKETDRKKILYKFLDLDIFDDKYRLAREEGRQYHKRLAEMEESDLEEIASKLRTRVERKKVELESNVNRESELVATDKKLDDMMADLAAQKVKVDDDLDERAATAEITDADLKLETLVPKTVDLDDQFVELDVELKKILKLEQKFDLDAYEEKERRLKHVRDEIEFRRRAIKEKKPDTTSYRKSLKLLEEVPCGNQFPQCQFLIDAFRAKEKLPVVEENITRWEAEIVELETEASDLAKSQEKLDLYRGFLDRRSNLETAKASNRLQLENLQLKIESLQKQRARGRERLEKIRQAHETIARNAEIDRNREDLRQQRAQLFRDLTTLRSETSELTKQLGSDEGVLEKLDAQLDQLSELRDTCVAFEHYCQAMGKDGIAYRIMTQKLPLINDEINKILGGSAEFGVVIEHDNDEQSIRIFLQYGEYKMRLLELGSGAEKMLASVAIRAALLSISSLPKSNMFIIDEGFGKLDPRNIESVQRMFDYLKSVFEHVIVISHVDTMKDLVDNIVEISSDPEGYAHISVGG